MDQTEVYRRSALALGNPEGWDPFNNAEHRWACVEWILATGQVVLLNGGGFHHQTWGLSRYHEPALGLDCPAREFPARAVAEMHLRREQ